MRKSYYVILRYVKYLNGRYSNKLSIVSQHKTKLKANQVLKELKIQDKNNKEKNKYKIVYW